ncbi:gag protein [Ditylenchus destructor]|uniref:Gag protein n=1 Tax=Ditylenchus destructor TaxID=166010 RepID=A0AAD4QRP9_9BILA|nr:gag protein [Ditylenchus destructor]
MSAPIIAAISYISSEAENILANKRFSKVPIPLDVERSQPKIREISKAVSKVKLTISQLEEQIRNWNKIRLIMSKTELMLDLQTQTQFLDICNYPVTLIKLKDYLAELNNVQVEYDSAFDPSKPFSTPVCGNVWEDVSKLEIPHFDGDLLQWPEFWESFRDLIHDMDPAHLPPFRKLMYLRHYLNGRALNLIKNLPICEASYYKAVNILQEEFNNTTALKDALWYKFRAIRPINLDLCEFINELERIMHQLEQFGESLENIYTQQAILEKLPRWLIHKIVEFRCSLPQSSLWTTALLLSKLKEIVSFKEEVSKNKFLARCQFPSSQQYPENNTQLTEISLSVKADSIPNIENVDPVRNYDSVEPCKDNKFHQKFKAVCHDIPADSYCHSKQELSFPEPSVLSCKIRRISGLCDGNCNETAKETMPVPFPAKKTVEGPIKKSILLPSRTETAQRTQGLAHKEILASIHTKSLGQYPDLPIKNKKCDSEKFTYLKYILLPYGLVQIRPDNYIRPPRKPPDRLNYDSLKFNILNMANVAICFLALGYSYLQLCF